MEGNEGHRSRILNVPTGRLLRLLGPARAAGGHGCAWKYTANTGEDEGDVEPGISRLFVRGRVTGTEGG